MSVEQAVIEKLRVLPPERQQEVLDFVESLQQKSPLTRSRRSLMGLWSNLEIDTTDEDIREARREMWGNFPRDIT